MYSLIGKIWNARKGKRIFWVVILLWLVHALLPLSPRLMLWSFLHLKKTVAVNVWLDLLKLSESCTNTPILSSFVIEFSPKDTKIYQIVGHLCTDVVNILKLVRCVLVGFSNEKRNRALNNFRSLAKKKKKRERTLNLYFWKPWNNISKVHNTAVYKRKSEFCTRKMYF